VVQKVCDGGAGWKIWPPKKGEEPVPLAWKTFATPYTPDPLTFGHRLRAHCDPTGMGRLGASSTRPLIEDQNRIDYEAIDQILLGARDKARALPTVGGGRRRLDGRPGLWLAGQQG
jgi:hypothetical protein